MAFCDFTRFYTVSSLLLLFLFMGQAVSNFAFLCFFSVISVFSFFFFFVSFTDGLALPLLIH